jgi:hypothetical protein
MKIILGELGSLADDDEAFPGRDMRFEPGRPTANARRDWRNDAAFEISLRGHLLKDDLKQLDLFPDRWLL